jgi:SPP1 gp7 family putative phage head morphogenesis protein
VFATDGLDLINEEMQFVDKAINKGLKIALDLEFPAPKQVWAAAIFASYSADGHETFETYLNGLSDSLYKVWDTNVRAGYLAGLTAREINRAVLGSLNDMEPGQLQGLRRSLERNTRTMVSSLAETARDAAYKENESLFDGYRYVGTLDTRTCASCFSVEGTIFQRLEDGPKLPQHYSCRCLYVPYIKGFEDIPGERAAMDGPVPEKWTYKDWFEQLDPAVQEDILGPGRYKLYQDGMAITSFVQDGRILTLEQLRKKEEMD